MRERAFFYLLGYKPRVLWLVIVTAALGFFMPSRVEHISFDFLNFLITMVGTGLSCSGASVLNQVIERDSDARMGRTKSRPVASGRISPGEALAGGIILVLVGVSMLALLINLLSAFLALMTAFLYVVVYTPLKRITWLNTIIGAIPGALPPLGGWAAATGNLTPMAWVLFFVVFLWQEPHFYAIAWMYREDYSKAGYKMLPDEDLTGRRTFQQIIVFTIALIIVSLLPLAMGISSSLYAAGALVSGIFFLLPGIKLAQAKTVFAARQVLRASVWYLPVILTLIAVGLH